MGEPVVFGTSLGALLLQGVPRPVSPAGRQQLLALGLDLDRPLLAAYSLATWVGALQVAARDVYPDRPLGEAYEALGRDTIAGLRQTRMGQASHEKNRAVGVHRALERFTRTFRISNNYIETRLTTLGLGDYRLGLQPVPEMEEGVLRAGLPPAPFYVGVFSATLTGWGVEEPQVSLLEEDAARCRYLFSFRFHEEPG
jgi:uncharacterized protein (TIGR02265 family)